MGTEVELGDILEHYGIKGMKWGVRRSDEQLARARGRLGRRKSSGPPSEDAEKAAAAQKKANTQGVQSLSNQELRDLSNRLNLEQNYARVATPNKKKSAGAKFAQDLILNQGKQELTKVANEQMSKAMGQMMAQAAAKKAAGLAKAGAEEVARNAARRAFS